MIYNERGEHVRELQVALVKAGYKLPKFGVDGHLGDETWEAIKEFALDHSLDWSPIIEDESVKVILSGLYAINKLQDSTKTVPSIDLTNEPVPFGYYNKFRLKAGKVYQRVNSVVDGVVLHQTACVFSVSQRAMEEAGGDRMLALARRVKKIACHACSFNGFYVKTYPLDWYIYHANSLNRKTLGLEIEGAYPGLLDDPTTVVREDKQTLWNAEATELTPGRVEAAREALAYLVEEGRRAGMDIKYLYAHRQASSRRLSDPGEEIWQKVGLDYGVKFLGLETRPAFTVGSGAPIPSDWDDNGVGPY